MQNPTLPRRKSTVSLQPRDLDVLQSLFESRLATREHLAQLHFAGSYEAAQNRLKKLRDGRLLKASPAGIGKPEILSLALAGFDALKAHRRLERYPRFTRELFEDRKPLSPITIEHELAVMNVKAAFVREARSGWEHLTVREFITWPLLYSFGAFVSHHSTERQEIKPDSFIELELPERLRFFLEVDRGSEKLDTILRKCHGYQDFYQSGGMAARCGVRDPRDAPFRVIFSVESEARRNNIAEALLREGSILKIVWITTRAQIERDPFGDIYLTPLSYRQAVTGTAHDPGHVAPSELRQTRKGRDDLVRAKAVLAPLF